MARRRRRNEDEEDDDLDDAPARPAKTGPRSDAYVGMLAVTFLALATSAALLYMDFDSLSGQQVTPPVVNVPALGAPGAAAPPAAR